MVTTGRIATTALVWLVSTTQQTRGWNFTMSNGQIFTPGFAVLDAPQPYTPLGGDTLEVALDVSANGKLILPPYASSSPSKIYDISMFLYSYRTGRNLTISNGTATANNASLGPIMQSEPGSTVKHVRWTWPDCLVGNGQDQNRDRGDYNMSIRQNFRLNGADHYTIFDVPIAVTNSIGRSASRGSCDGLNNRLLAAEELVGTADDKIGVLFGPGDATQVEAIADNGDESEGGRVLGSGAARTLARPRAGLLGWYDWVAVAGSALVFLLVS